MLALFIGAGFAAQARAATFTVTTTSDFTGSCDPTMTSGCSLREIIGYENGLTTTPNPPDTISLPAGFYDLGSGVLTV